MSNRYTSLNFKKTRSQSERVNDRSSGGMVTVWPASASVIGLEDRPWERS